MKLKKSMIQWACRRGMLELDIIINNFFDNKFDSLNSLQKKLFFKMLMHEDNCLYQWLIYNKKPKNKNIYKIVLLIKKFFSNMQN